MNENQKAVVLKILVPVAFLAMVTVNALANILPINGVGTGQVADSYPNLFAPAGYAFSIWGLIYVLLAGFVLYFATGRSRSAGEELSEALPNIALYFIVSSLANTGWIFAWHYRLIPLSALLIVIMLYSLAFIAGEFQDLTLNRREYILIRLPFSIYYGWVTVAVIANITVLLVSMNWSGWGLPEATWAVAMLLAGAVIGGKTVLRLQDPAYGLVIIWAYLAILYKHLSSGGFAGAYPAVASTAGICSLVLLALVIHVGRELLRAQD